METRCVPTSHSLLSPCQLPHSQIQLCFFLNIENKEVENLPSCRYLKLFQKFSNYHHANGFCHQPLSLYQ